jgi:outer membrane protein OmpA-like peptidoglycan-associated protein
VLPGQDTFIAPGAPGIAYRLPDTGQLVISRPSTLLFPPQQFPQSHLTVPLPEGRAAARAMAAPEPDTAQTAIQPPAEPTPPTEPAAPLQPVAQEPAVAAPSPEPEPEIAPEPTIMPEPAPPPVAAITPPAEPSAPSAVAALPTEPAPTEEVSAPPAAVPELPSAEPVNPPGTEAAGEPLAAPEPEPSPAATPQASESQSAALTPATAAVGETRLLFGDGSAELTARAAGQLDTLATALQQDADARVQLLAYAKASDDGTSKARRLSLSRALAVRAYLIERGVRSTRMDVRALGSGFSNGPADRVDILPQKTE